MMTFVWVVLAAAVCVAVLVLAYEPAVWVRDRVLLGLYRFCAKPILFRFDPEACHGVFNALGEWMGLFGLTRLLTRVLFGYSNHDMLAQTLFGCLFESPVGLAAGFDKNARLVPILPQLGFGFQSIGSITGEPCEGNARPRLWRIPAERGLIVYYGLKNDGGRTIAARLESGPLPEYPVFTSIAATNCQRVAESEANGIADFCAAGEALRNWGAVTEVNISCPNAFGGESFAEPARLDRLLTRLTPAVAGSKPVVLKLAIGYEPEALDAILELCLKHKVAGVVCCNLLKDRSGISLPPNTPPQGGISGRLTQGRSTALISYIYGKMRHRAPGFVVVGVGGIETAEDAFEKICAGASLVQLVTGLIYRGPSVVSDINQGLCRLLRKHGFRSVSEAVGSNHSGGKIV